MGDLLGRYKDDMSAEYLHTKALWLFRTEGPERKANRALQKALEGNEFVPAYLLVRSSRIFCAVIDLGRIRTSR